jgi:hypothetical protein
VTTTSTLTLAHAGFRVRVDGEDAAMLRWLREFLAPWFEPAPGPADYRIAVRIDPAAGEPEPAAVTGSVHPFLFDSPVAPCPARDQGEQRTIYDRPLGVHYVVRPRGRCAEIVAPSPGGGLRVALMRVVRELATIHAAGRGALLLHAAAWGAGGPAIVLAGPKGGGKTTLLLHLLEHAGGRFVANDRCLVQVDGPRATVTGIPTIVSIRPATLALLPALAGRLDASGYQHTLTIAECRASRLAGRPDLSPAQLCDLAGVEPVVGGPLGALVFLDADGPARPFELRALSAEGAASRIEAAFLGGRTPRRTAPVWLGHAAGDGESTAAPVARLAAGVPCFGCRVDRAGPLAPAAVRNLAARLVAAAT